MYVYFFKLRRNDITRGRTYRFVTFLGRREDCFERDEFSASFSIDDTFYLCKILNVIVIVRSRSLSFDHRR